METLRPCPFCGGKARFTVRTYDRTSKNIGFCFNIECLSCGVHFPSDYIVRICMNASGEIDIREDERQKAIDMWNGVKNEGGN
jgi:Lar family restriction alleviation protein